MERICTTDIRKKKRVSRKRLAAASGVTAYTIQLIDWGEEVEPFLAAKIAKALSVSVEELKVE